VKSVPTIAALISLTLAASITQVGCSKSDHASAKTESAVSTPVPEGMVRGPVLETMDAAGYTYVQIDTGTEKRWIAGPKSQIKIGDIVQVKEGMAMPGFQSKALDRTFDVVYFVPGIENLTNPAAAVPAANADYGSATPTKTPTDHPLMDSKAGPAAEDVTVSPVEEGKNIAELYENKTGYEGKEVTLRGKVVKYNANIMGWNFVHIRDGSGDPAKGTNDVTITTKDVTELGATVVATGKVSLNTDFGAGYAYPVLIEEASLKAE
jgi:hypothetical protein